MRTINKRPEPRSLTTHRNSRHCDYDNFQDMDALRRALLTEQRGLCCYCMGRIRNDPAKMKVEHWQCQSRYPTEQLNYRNLLAACWGGDGRPPRLQHCDTRKGDSDLKWNPADPSRHIEGRVWYELDGTIHSNDPDFDGQLNEVLNLNLPVLKRNRKALLDVVLEWWQHARVQTRGPVSRHRFVRKRDQFVGENRELAQYCQVVVWWLDQKLARMVA